MAGSTNGKGGSALPSSPDLFRFMAQVLGGPEQIEGLSLRELRERLTSKELLMSAEGELLFPLDRLSLINELDALIDKSGQDERAGRSTRPR